MNWQWLDGEIGYEDRCCGCGQPLRTSLPAVRYRPAADYCWDNYHVHCLLDKLTNQSCVITREPVPQCVKCSAGLGWPTLEVMVICDNCNHERLARFSFVEFTGPT